MSHEDFTQYLCGEHYRANEEGTEWVLAVREPSERLWSGHVTGNPKMLGSLPSRHLGTEEF